MAAKRTGLIVGVADHGGWAILVTASPSGALTERRRVELVSEALPKLPHHHEGQKLPLKEAVALVTRVRTSAAQHAKSCLAAMPEGITKTVAERITNYRAMCVADWVMYREALAHAAIARGWRVQWYDARKVFAEAARVLDGDNLEDVLLRARAKAGPPWQKDHRVAMAAAIAAARAR